MALEGDVALDATSWRLLEELQQRGRLTYTELGQRVGLSLPAVAERVRRLEEAGIITGYHAEVNLSKLGMPVQALVHLHSIGGQSCTRAVSQVSAIPEVIECARVTGDDSIIMKVIATSLDHLARVIDQLSLHGVPTTSILRSNPFRKRPIPQDILARADDEELPAS